LGSSLHACGASHSEPRMTISAAAPIGTLYFVEPTLYKAQKALVAAKFNGVVLKEAKFDIEKEAKKPAFLSKNPTGKVPFLETDMGCIFTSNAIARYVARCRADTPIFGKTFNHEGLIDTWLEFCTHELEVPLATWVYPCMGLLEDKPEASRQAKEDVKCAMGMLEEQLASTKYLIGDFLTLADIATVCALREGFTRVFDPAFRKPYPKVCAWFEGCCAMPQFKAVLGEVQMCTEAQKPKPVPKAQQTAMPKAQPKAKAEPKAQPKAEPKGGAKAKPKAEPKAEPKAAPAAEPAAAPAVAGDAADQVKALGDQIRALKEKLKAEGLSNKQINAHETVMGMVAELQKLKAQPPAAAPAAASPAAAPPAEAPAAAAAPAAGGDIDGQIKAVGDEIRALKEKLKGEGLSNKQINAHEEVAKLVAQLQELKKQLQS